MEALLARILDSCFRFSHVPIAALQFPDVLCSYACLGLVVPSLMEALLVEIRGRLATETFNPQQLSNLLWALTILRLCTPEVRKRFEARRRRCKLSASNALDWHSSGTVTVCCVTLALPECCGNMTDTRRTVCLHGCSPAHACCL